MGCATPSLLMYRKTQLKDILKFCPCLKFAECNACCNCCVYGIESFGDIVSRAGKWFTDSPTLLEAHPMHDPMANYKVSWRDLYGVFISRKHLLKRSISALSNTTILHLGTFCHGICCHDKPKGTYIHTFIVQTIYIHQTKVELPPPCTLAIFLFYRDVREPASRSWFVCHLGLGESHVLSLLAVFSPFLVGSSRICTFPYFYSLYNFLAYYN